MNYYEHHLGDYLRDTAHLSMIEDGAYRRLIDAYYTREAPLPADEQQVCRLVRAASKQERAAVSVVLREFFIQVEAGWSHKRCDEEIQRLHNKSATARQSGLASAEARRQRMLNGRSTDVQRTLNEPSTECQLSSLQSPDTSHQSKKGSKKNPVELPLDGGPVDRIFDHWKTVHQHPRAKLDGKRSRVITAALKVYTEDEIRESITGYLSSPHHMGENDRAQTYTDLELLLRDAKHIEAGLGFARNPPANPQSPITRAIVASVGGWVPQELRNATE